MLRAPPLRERCVADPGSGIGIGDGPGLPPMGLLFGARRRPRGWKADKRTRHRRSPTRPRRNQPTADPWQAGALACWIHRAGGQPPQSSRSPYAHEIAGNWTQAATAYQPRTALRRRTRPPRGNTNAVRTALHTFTQLGAHQRHPSPKPTPPTRRKTRHPPPGNQPQTTPTDSPTANLHQSPGSPRPHQHPKSPPHSYSAQHRQPHVTAILTKLNVTNEPKRPQTDQARLNTHSLSSVHRMR